MSETNFTLFENESNYEEQISTDFGSSNYEENGYEIVSYPTAEDETLLVKLFVNQGSDNYIVHEFPIGNFPNEIENWRLEIDYIDHNGTPIKKVIKEQAEGEAEPRPIPNLG